MAEIIFVDQFQRDRNAAVGAGNVARGAGEALVA
jgi:hypothetical protein